MTRRRLGARTTRSAARVHQGLHAGWDDPALSWLLRRVSAGGATHETTDPVQAARFICCPDYCAAVITCSDASQVGEHAEHIAVGGDFASTFTSAPCAAGALS